MKEFVITAAFMLALLCLGMLTGLLVANQSKHCDAIEAKGTFI